MAQPGTPKKPYGKRKNRAKPMAPLFGETPCFNPLAHSSFVATAVSFTPQSQVPQASHCDAQVLAPGVFGGADDAFR